MVRKTKAEDRVLVLEPSALQDALEAAHPAHSPVAVVTTTKPRRTARAATAASYLPEDTSMGNAQDSSIQVAIAEALAAQTAGATRRAPTAVQALVAAPVIGEPVADISALTERPTYAKLSLGRKTVQLTVGRSKDIKTKDVTTKRGPARITEFRAAYNAPDAKRGDAATWFKVTIWDGDVETLDLIRQGAAVEATGRVTQSTRSTDGVVFMDMTAYDVERVGGNRATAKVGYFARLWNSIRGR